MKELSFPLFVYARKLRLILKTDNAHTFSYEDLRALDGGKQGLDVIEPILVAADNFLKSDGRIFMEVDPCHPYLIPDLLKSHSLRLEVSDIHKDFQDKYRFVELIKK